MRRYRDLAEASAGLIPTSGLDTEVFIGYQNKKMFIDLGPHPAHRLGAVDPQISPRNSLRFPTPAACLQDAESQSTPLYI